MTTYVTCCLFVSSLSHIKSDFLVSITLDLLPLSNLMLFFLFSFYRHLLFPTLSLSISPRLFSATCPSHRSLFPTTFLSRSVFILLSQFHHIISIHHCKIFYRTRRRLSEARRHLVWSCVRGLADDQKGSRGFFVREIILT